MTLIHELCVETVLQNHGILNDLNTAYMMFRLKETKLIKSDNKDKVYSFLNYWAEALKKDKSYYYNEYKKRYLWV